MAISVVILTLNEEVNLPGCLESIAWSDDVVVFDSHSTDRTVEIANEHGARVVQREFDNYATQRNAALHEVSYKYDWLLMVDADERWPADLGREMTAAVQAESNVTLYHFLRKDMFMGRWLKRSSGYPTWAGRLMKIDSSSVQREINEEYHTEGEKGYLQGHFIHYPFNKGIAYWFERHNRYSTMEAQKLLQETRQPWDWRHLLSRDPAQRRKCVKQLVYRLPGRPAIMFFGLYFLRFGFLDGRAGFHYCLMRAVYEYMIALKMREIKRKSAGLSI